MQVRDLIDWFMPRSGRVHLDSPGCSLRHHLNLPKHVHYSQHYPSLHVGNSNSTSTLQSMIADKYCWGASPSTILAHQVCWPLSLFRTLGLVQEPHHNRDIRTVPMLQKTIINVVARHSSCQGCLSMDYDFRTDMHEIQITCLFPDANGPINRYRMLEIKGVRKSSPSWLDHISSFDSHSLYKSLFG